MSQLPIKEKIIATNQLILSQEYLRKIIQVSGKKYDIDTLVRFKYIAVIKKGESYYNLLLKSFIDPYILGDAYMKSHTYMYGGFDRYNREGFTTQVSNIFTIYNEKYSRKIKILGISFVFKKVKKEFLYGYNVINNVSYMEKERLFIEYVRDYITYDNTFFLPILESLDKKKLNTYIKKYPLKTVDSKINTLLCI